MPHTPTPWKTVAPGHGHETPHLCVQIGEDETYTTLELLADDARLVAAAPDLLAACELALQSFVRWTVLSPADEAACKALQAAIAKAASS